MNPAWLSLAPRFARPIWRDAPTCQRVITNTGWVLVERALRYAIGFLVGVWIARYVGPEQYGLLNYAGGRDRRARFMSTLGLETRSRSATCARPRHVATRRGTLLTLRLARGCSWSSRGGGRCSATMRSRAAVMIIADLRGPAPAAFDSLDCCSRAVVASRYARFRENTSLPHDDGVRKSS